MNTAVFLVGKKIQEIVDNTMQEYSFLNISGEKVAEVEYSESIPVERMQNDVTKMQTVFADCVNCSEYSFNDISAVFAMLCTCCAKHKFDYALGDQFDVDSFLTSITDDKKHSFLSLLGKAICGLVYPYKDIESSSFNDAYRLFPDNEIINLYRFIGLVQLQYAENSIGIADLIITDYADKSNWQELIHQDMISSYSKLSEPLKEYAIIGKDASSNRDDNLPYLEYAPYSEGFMNACLSDFKGISEGVSLVGNEGDAQRLLKILSVSRQEFVDKREKFASEPTSLNLMFLFSRLNELQEFKDKDNSSAEDEESVVDGDTDGTEDEACIEYDDDIDSNGDEPSFLMRKLLLGIPCSIEPSANDFHNLFTETLRAEVRTAERDRAIAEKETVIRDFAHTYGNMKATGLYTIAQTLLKNEDIESKRLGRQVLLEYGIKQDLTKAVYMMRLRFEENTQKLRMLLQDSISNSSESDSENIGNIISSALQLSLLRVFYDRSDRKAELAREQMKKTVEKLNPLRGSFEHTVIFSGTDAIRWMNEQITSVNLSISNQWEQLAFRKESYATVFLRDIFAECFFNILKYANLNQPISLSLSECENEFRIEIVNNVAQLDSIYSGVGLSSKSAMLDIINGRTTEDSEKSMDWCVCEGSFRVCILLKKSALKGD